jgi:hypothetical protein
VNGADDERRLKRRGDRTIERLADTLAQPKAGGTPDLVGEQAFSLSVRYALL